MIYTKQKTTVKIPSFRKRFPATVRNKVISCTDKFYRTEYMPFLSKENNNPVLINDEWVNQLIKEPWYKS